MVDPIDKMLLLWRLVTGLVSIAIDNELQNFPFILAKSAYNTWLYSGYGFCYLKKKEKEEIQEGKEERKKILSRSNSEA